ncbi:Carbon monoxide dehydrogenase medium chain (plasmid) [Roseivivax sp. THAF197b]|nr:Carbon monoxide dehydrogenase medium chain [Roseivivax sp. THAF197b]
MIPAAFDYYRPKDMDGVLSLLQEHGDEARVMAGGHTGRLRESVKSYAKPTAVVRAARGERLEGAYST